MLLTYIRIVVRKNRREWKIDLRKLVKQIPSSYHSILADLEDIFLNETSQLLENLQSPSVTILITGTTSSGKSTLVNLLCGAEIIPAAVQEMSAGLVTILHSQHIAIHIDRTPNALWDCGDWYHLSDREIYDRLSSVMNSYLSAKERGEHNVRYPQIRIEYPLRLLAKNSRLQLPRGIQLKIIDLPGLAHQGDTENLSLLNICNRALFLVTYNSAETDRQKTNILLQAVVKQLQIVGGLSKNMLFLFNRIDIFHADRDPIGSAEKFINRTRSEIDKLLTKYHLKLESSQIIKISTMPALLSLLIRSKDSSQRYEAASRLDRNFNFLITDNITENLPRNPVKWSSQEYDRVASVVWDISYAGEFERVLIDVIQASLADLVFLPIIREFEQKLCIKISECIDRSTDRDPIRERLKATSISNVKIFTNRLLKQIDISLKIFIKFKQFINLFKQYFIR